MRTVSLPTETACEDLLAAVEDLGVTLDRDAVLSQARLSARDSSWSSADFLLTWAEMIRETRRLPRALAKLAQRKEGA